MFRTPLISICIPTFNRGDKLYKLVNDILQFEGSEIEVLVLDNLSSDNTELLLSKVNDSRLTYLRNEFNIGGVANSLTALSLAKGEYAFLCLDKDRIDSKNIKELINRIQSDRGVVFGHCVLNSSEYLPDILYDKGFPSVLNMSYLSIHPSGMFYKTEIYKELDILKKVFKGEVKFGFYTDLINGEMSFFGKSRLINFPLFYTETKEDSKAIPSFTYKKSNDVFFSPPKRFEEFLTYSKGALNLPLLKNQKQTLVKVLFERGLIASTVGYKNILGDSFICAHYFIVPRKVSLFELIRIDFRFSHSFIKSNLPISLVIKIYICFSANLRPIYSVFRRSHS